MVSGDVQVKTRDHVLYVLIDRPAKRNALSRSVLAQLGEVFAAAADDDELVAAVLRGAGDKSFAAGGDLADLASVRSLAEAAEMSLQAKAALETIRQFPVPVIAALNGDALGGGAELAVACDFRIFAAHARIGFIQGRLKITTAWGGGLDLAHLVGPARAMRLLSRSELLSGEDAMGIGLADAIAGDDLANDNLDHAVSAFLEPMLTQAPHVMRAFKALNLAQRQGASRQDLLDLETRNFTAAWVHDDHWAASDGILKKEKPK
jgi:enoyl-CoA hydratase